MVTVPDTLREFTMAEFIALNRLDVSVYNSAATKDIRAWLLAHDYEQTRIRRGGKVINVYRKRQPPLTERLRQL
jgi:hypothetical protein